MEFGYNFNGIWCGLFLPSGDGPVAGKGQVPNLARSKASWLLVSLFNNDNIIHFHALLL